MEHASPSAAPAAPPTAPLAGARRPTWSGQAQLMRQGVGVRNLVAIGAAALPDLDPFLIFAEFGGDAPEDYVGGFPDHPHRGFETVTYVVEGHVRHADSRGNSGRLGPGGVQRMKAARGLLHAEMADQAEGRLQAFQLWINLPARHKMDEPAYQDEPSERIPVIERDGVSVRVLVGDALGAASPIPGGATDLVFLDLHLSPGSGLTVPLPPGHTAFAYVYEGSARLAGEEAPARTITVFTEGDRLEVAADMAARILLLAATPLREPVAKGGPFVMNTDAEIQQAFADYQAGLFNA